MRVIVKGLSGSDYANLKADKLVREDSIILVYNGSELVGIFDIGAVDALYLSGEKENK